MPDTATYRDDIVFYGSRVDAGDLSRENAAIQLHEVSAHRIRLREARQLVDIWQAYLTAPLEDPAPVRRPLLARLFTRRTTNPKGTTTR